MNTPVNFEISKLLKEKRITIGGFKYYDNGGILNHSVGFISSNAGLVLAPTIAEVVMWLYEKHEYWCYTYTNGKIWYPCIQHKFGDMAVLSGKIGTYNSSIEAYEEAIKYTLNNLI